MVYTVYMNQDKLKSIMKRHSLTRPQVAKLSKVSVRTVNSWLLPVDSKGHRACPDMAIELLNCKLEDK